MYVYLGNLGIYAFDLSGERLWTVPMDAHPITVTTEGHSKPPQIGTEYSNQYAAELAKQGLTEKQIRERVYARDLIPKREFTFTERANGPKASSSG